MDDTKLKIPYQATERNQNQNLYAYPASAKAGVNDSTYENVGVHVSRLPEYVQELHQKESGFKKEFEVINFVKGVVNFIKC